MLFFNSWTEQTGFDYLATSETGAQELKFIHRGQIQMLALKLSRQIQFIIPDY